MLALKHFGFDQAFSDPNSFFGDFFVTNGDATLIAFIVLVIGVLIGMIGAFVGPAALPAGLTPTDPRAVRQQPRLWLGVA